MKLPRGFGKNYFSLNAIVATVNGVAMHKESSRVERFHLQSSSFIKEDETIDELEELESSLLSELCLSTKGCHCNFSFLQQTKKTLKLFSCQKKYKDFFITLNSSISPPKNMFFNIGLI